jgi:hypothetical protein
MKKDFLLYWGTDKEGDDAWMVSLSDNSEDDQTLDEFIRTSGSFITDLLKIDEENIILNCCREDSPQSTISNTALPAQQPQPYTSHLEPIQPITQVSGAPYAPVILASQVQS